MLVLVGKRSVNYRFGGGLYMMGLDMTGQLIGLGPSDHPSSPGKGQSGVLQDCDRFTPGSRPAQPPGSRPQASWVATHGQQVAPLRDFYPLQGGS